LPHFVPHDRLEAQSVGQRLRRLDCSLEWAAIDVRDALAAQAPGKPFGLPQPFPIEVNSRRPARDTFSHRVGFSVADEKNGGHSESHSMMVTELHASGTDDMKLVIFGLSVSSSWGNGHATLWRGLLRALAKRGHTVVFFERDTPYYAEHRDLTELADGELILYSDWDAVLPLARR